MGLILWWMPIVWLVVVVIALGIGAVMYRRHRSGARGLPVAQVDRMTALPAYRTAMTKYLLVLASLCCAAAVVLISGVTLASRPAATAVVTPELRNRDIVLCLDVSGSMIDYDAELVEVFSALAREFDGERLSLVVFNASAVTYFPLTSDYAYVQEQLAEISRQFATNDTAYFDGTFFGDGSSLVGDGLAACTLRFDTPTNDEPGRSRSVVLATDNLVIGDPIFTLAEAGRLASDDGIIVYGLNPGDRSSKEYLDQFAAEFEDVVAGTGGSYHALDDPDAVPAIVDRITSEQAQLIRGAPQLVETDRPAVPLVLAFVGLAGLFVFAWRLRL